KNEVYVGDLIFCKSPSRNVITGEIDKDWKPKYVRDHHVGIVDRETWDAVQARLEASRRGGLILRKMLQNI
ncbi:MAG: recombinase family protein, partial [Parabacteroides sp.]|nr:recombinase family protein [Parabacteroides sp.]